MAAENIPAMIAQIMLAQQTLALTATQALDGLAVPLLTHAQANAWLKDSNEEHGKEENSKDTFRDEVRDPWA